MVDERVDKARSRALAHLDSMLESAVEDEGTGLPSWVVRSGIGPADGSPIDV